MIEGIDGPRPLPPDLRARLEAAIVAGAGPLAGLDGPRDMPTATRARLESALAVTHPKRRTIGGTRIAAAAAVIVLLAGVAAVAAHDDRKPIIAARGRGSEVAAATTTTTSTTSTTTPALIGPLASSKPVIVTLEFKDTCGELLDYLKANANDKVTAYGLGQRAYAVGGGAGVAAGPAGPGDTAGAGGASSAPQASTTNNQEQGVDEPDMVQNDGRYIYVMNGGIVRVVDAGVSPPQLVASLTTNTSATMFLAGNRLLLFGAGSVAADQATPYGRGTTTVTSIDVSDPTTPSIAEQFQLDGAFVSARLVDGLARVVVSSSETLPFLYPSDPSPEANDAALAHNRGVVNDSVITQWIGDRPCSSVGLPTEFSGFDMTTVYTIDPKAPDASRSAGVIAGSEMVYASTTSLFVTSMRWDAWQVPIADGAPPQDVHTQVHQFDISGRGSPRYVASGQVDGYALNQYSFSERNGNLRIATTNHPTWQQGAASSESAVTVLALRDGILQPIGAVGGLGAGQTIQGVRFVDDLGFVVTFLRTDPLYVIDLGDPTNPTVRGALEVTGYSAYLHPIEEGFLVGVGQSADDSGRTTGEQVSVYDVRNLDQPALVGRVEMPDAYSSADYDPHACLYWAPRALTVIPIQGSDPASGDAVVLQTSSSGVVEVGRVHRPRDSQYGVSGSDRSLVIGDTLFTISYAGVQATNLDTLGDAGWAPFPPG